MNHAADQGYTRRRFAVSGLSPEGRLRFHQVSSHWYGRLFRAPIAALYRLMSVPLFRFLAATALNPYLVIESPAPGREVLARLKDGAGTSWPAHREEIDRSPRR